ncbi:MAG: DNA polymerase III subunit delta [Acidobacteriota bacterium]
MVAARSGEAPPRNCVLWATDPRLMVREAEAWCAFWGEGNGAASLSGPDATPAILLGELRSVPMFRSVQPVRVRHAEAVGLETLQALADYLNAPSPSAALLLEVAADLGKKDRQGNLVLKDLKNSGIWKDILGAATVKSCQPASVRAYARDRARSEGMRIGDDALEALYEWSHGELALVVRALDLLLLYKREERVVEAADLQALLGSGGTPSQWEAVDAWVQGEAKAFVHRLAGLRRDPDAEPLGFLGMAAKQMRGLLYLRAIRAKGGDPGKVPPKELGYSYAFQVQKLADALDRWPEARIRLVLNRLFELDLALKGAPGDPWGHVQRVLLRTMVRAAASPP